MDKNQLYNQRLTRYVTAMRNEMPDMIPIRPFVAEFTAKYAGFTSQEVVHDYEKAFIAARKCAADFDWDAVVGNMVWVWTGLTQAIGLRYYGIPGIHIPAEMGFQYREPSEDDAFMKEDEYDQLIDDPTGFLYNVWLPRVSTEIVPPGEPNSYRNNLALVKGGMAMWKYFMSFGEQNRLLREESGTPTAICGIFKAPFDILADKLRGYIGLTMDMMTQPKKVLQACEALMPHLYNVAATSADPNRRLPIGYWMHRGCKPFVSAGQFESHYWPTVKPIIEELWKNGHQTLFYAEGDWKHHLESFTELPEKSIVYHVDRGDILEVAKVLGGKFCLSGGIPNFLLSHGSLDDLRAHLKKVIDGVARDGGYIVDASAIMQNDTDPQRLRVLTDFVREYGVYSTGHAAGHSPSSADDLTVSPPPGTEFGSNFGMSHRPTSKIKPGVCFPWEEKLQELPNISGDQQLTQRIWEEIEGLGNTFIWHCLLSF
jgi:hypothetical protein